MSVLSCAECDRCKSVDFGYTEHYCCVENEALQIFDFLGTQLLLNSISEWCPKRSVDNISERGEIELWVIN